MTPLHLGLDGLPNVADNVLYSQAPSWAVQSFTVINAIIALSYGLLALYFIRRIKLPRGRERNPLTVVAMVGATLFFVGCAHTHVDIALWSAEDRLIDHWYTWLNVISHALQGAGGITFWVLATFFLQLNIFDKKHYEKTLEAAIDADDNAVDAGPPVEEPVEGPPDSTEGPVDRQKS